MVSNHPLKDKSVYCFLRTVALLILSKCNYQNVINDQMISIQTLVFSIALGIPQHIEENPAGLLWPSTLGGLEGLALGMSADTAVEPPRKKKDKVIVH